MKSLVNKLSSMGWRISVAESCTGGTVSKMITDIPGASSVFDMAVTTYSNEAKIKFSVMRQLKRCGFVMLSHSNLPLKKKITV